MQTNLKVQRLMLVNTKLEEMYVKFNVVFQNLSESELHQSISWNFIYGTDRLDFFRNPQYVGFFSTRVSHLRIQ